jgi:hypothetical protein
LLTELLWWVMQCYQIDSVHGLTYSCTTKLVYSWTFTCNFSLNLQLSCEIYDSNWKFLYRVLWWNSLLLQNMPVWSLHAYMKIEWCCNSFLIYHSKPKFIKSI